MTNAINNLGNSTPFDMGDMGGMPGAAQNGMQTETRFSSVKVFSPDDGGQTGGVQAMGGSQHAHHHHAATNDDTNGAQGAGNAGQNGGDMSNMLGQFMNILKQAISAAMQIAPPLLAMAGSMMGGMGGMGGMGQSDATGGSSAT